MLFLWKNWGQCEVAYRDGDIYELENEINDTMIYETLHLYWAFEQSRKEEAQYPWSNMVLFEFGFFSYWKML